MVEFVLYIALGKVLNTFQPVTSPLSDTLIVICLLGVGFCNAPVCTANMPTAPPSIWARKLDLLYFIFFIIHIPVMLGRCPLDSLNVPLMLRYVLATCHVLLHCDNSYIFDIFVCLFLTSPFAAVDLAPFYPSSIRPQFTVDIRTWYIATYKDRLFTRPPAWFNTYMLMEALYHIPLSLWAIPALLHDDPLVPLHLLLWAVQTGVTTLTCVVEAMSWEGFTGQEKGGLAQLYVPYLVLGEFCTYTRRILLGKRLGPH